MKHLSLIEPLEARIAPATFSGHVDLALTIDSVKLPGDGSVLVPGDEGSITYTIHNNDPTVTFKPDSGQQPLDVNLWLSKGTGPFPYGYQYDPSFLASYQFIKIGEPDIKVTIPPGGSVQRTEKFTMPDLNLGATTGPTAEFTVGATFNLTPGGGYHILAEVDGAFAVDSLAHDNNSDYTKSTFEWAFKLGKVGTRDGVGLSAKDPDGTTVFFDPTGPASGEFQMHNSPNTADLVLNNTTEATSLVTNVLKSKPTSNDRFALANITVNGAMKNLKMRTADVSGNINITGALAGLQLGNVGGAGKSLTIGGIANVSANAATTIILEKVNDLNLTAPAGIAVLEASSWGIGANPDTITTPFLTDLSTTDGDFAASLNLAGPSPGGVAVKSADIAGALLSGTWTVQGDIQKIDASSIASGWKLLGHKHAGVIFSDPADTDVDKVIVTNAMGGLLEGASFKKVEIFGDFTGQINATPEDVSHGLNSFKAAKVIGGAGAGILNIGGKIGKISVQSWTGGSMTARDFDEITVKGGKDILGNLTGATVTATGAGTAVGLGKLSATGSLVNVTIDVAQAYVNTITADEWISGKLTAQGLLNLQLKGDTKNVVRGDLSNVTIKLFDPSSKLIKVDVKGLIDTSTIQSLGKIGTLQALGMNGATISATGVDGMDKLIIKGKESGVNFFVNSNVTATRIDSVLVSNVKTTNNGTAFGFHANAIDKYLRKQNGKVEEALVGLIDATKSPFDAVNDYSVVIGGV